MRKTFVSLGLAVLLAGCSPSLAAPTPASTPGAAAALAAPAASVVFDGDSFFMVDEVETKSSMVKEFLIDGETFDSCSRKITFRLVPGKDLRVLEKQALARFDDARPGYVQGVMYRSRKRLDEDFLFPDGEYQLWGWQLTPRGIETFELSLKMKDQAKLKALVDEKREHWRKELARIEKLVPSILK